MEKLTQLILRIPMILTIKSKEILYIFTNLKSIIKNILNLMGILHIIPPSYKQIFLIECSYCLKL